MPPHSHATHWPAALALLAVTVVWGVSFPMVQWGIQDIGVYPFLAIRFGAAALLLALGARGALRHTPPGTTRIGIVLGLFATACFISQTEGLRFTTAGNSALITSMYLLAIPVWKWLAGRQTIAPIVWFSVALAVCGMYLLTNYSWNGWNLGDGLTAITAVVTAGHMLTTERVTHRLPLLPIVFWQVTVTALCTALIATVTHAWPVRIAPITWFSLGFTTLLCTVAALLIQTWAQRHIPSERIGLICALEGMFGLFAGIILSHEQLTWLSALGAILMIIATVSTELHAALRRARPIDAPIEPTP